MSRSHIGYPLFLAAIGAMLSLGVAIGHLGEPIGWGLLAAGIGLAVCCVGLWGWREWARWSSAAIFAAMFLVSVRVPQPRATNYVNLFLLLCAVVYLVLPSTGKLFARARGERSSSAGADAERAKR